MSADPNRKSPRTFHCRDILWETFEQMAKDLECSVDYLINESMKQYARSKNYGSRVAPSSIAPAASGVAPPHIPQAPPGPQVTALQGATTAQSKTASRIPPPPPRGASNVPPPRATMPPMPTAPNRAVLAPAAVTTGSTLKGVAAAVNPSSSKRQPSSPKLAVKPATLSILYKGEKFPVTKDRFILGRGRQTSDFTLKDPNVSRQHAMIELQNGTYFMVDMGSTNGVEFNGQRVARKPIAEGDVYTICDHELVCTYR